MAQLRAKLAELKAANDAGLLPHEAYIAAAAELATSSAGGKGSYGRPSHKLNKAARMAIIATNPLSAARIQLAAAHRVASKLGLAEAGTSCEDRFSILHPTVGNTMLAIPMGVKWSTVTAADVTMNPLDQSASSDILAAVHQNLPPTKTTLLHTHSTYISAVTTLADNEVKMHNLRALRFDGRIAYQPRTPSSGVQLAELLSTTKDILFLANGGSIIVGTSISSALEDLVSLEAVCKNQIIAMSTGAPLVTVSNETRASYKAICTDAIKKSGEVFLETFMDAFDGTEPDFVSLDRRDGAYPNVSASGASGKASGALMLNAGASESEATAAALVAAQEESAATLQAMKDFKEALITAGEEPLDVERGSVVEIRVENTNPGKTKLDWSICTEAHDIGFGVDFDTTPPLPTTTTTTTAGTAADGETAAPVPEGSSNGGEAGVEVAVAAAATSVGEALVAAEADAGGVGEGAARSASPNPENVETVVPMKRHDAFDTLLTGTLTSEKAGTWVLIFDNSYSIFRGKKVFYKISAEEA